MNDDEYNRLKRFILFSWALLLAVMLMSITWASYSLRDTHNKIDNQNTKIDSIAKSSGPKGDKGEDGVSVIGPRGAKGADGTNGVNGKDGVQGEQGVQGPAGQKGKAGRDGREIELCRADDGSIGQRYVGDSDCVPLAVP